MKTVFLLLALVSSSFANDAFLQGFLDSLNRQQQAQLQQVPQQKANPDYPVPNRAHFDVIDAYGNRGGYFFMNVRQCYTFVSNSGGYFVDCIWIDRK